MASVRVGGMSTYSVVRTGAVVLNMTPCNASVTGAILV